MIRTGVLVRKPHNNAEAARLLALCRLPGVDWSFLAREAQRPDGLRRLLDGQPTEATAQSRQFSRVLRATGAPDTAAMRRQITTWSAAGLRLVTVLDEDYPLNLRTIFNLPPFLFVIGGLEAEDAFGVAVVGTRTPTAAGVRRARRMAEALARTEVTVLSGLARGIDSAAHEACLDSGGRTIAVLGSGLLRIYPPENESLASRIARHGAVVSQFWPDAPPAHYNFPRRNVVTSGMSQGTVVIEASATSGAKMQARLALEHGKRVFLLSSLVREHEWAARYSRRGAIVVNDVADVLRHLRPVSVVRGETQQRFQLSLALA